MWWSNEKKGNCLQIALPVFLIKASKHLALLVCLLILGRASGRYQISELSLLGVTVLAAVVHLWGRSLQRRSVWTIPPQGRPP
jgi:uncharacterized membrane protein YcaP (DUF421 family)